jgi:multiple sugar transport system substrate-binding protein
MRRAKDSGNGRRRIRRRAAAAGAAAATGLLVAACGASGSGASGGQDTNGQTLTVYAVNSGIHSKQTDEYYSYLSKEFHKETGASISWEYYTSPSQEASEIETSIVSGSGPDVFGVGPSYVTVAAASSAFTSLTAEDWKLLGGRGVFLPKPFQQAGSSGVGIPYQESGTIITYNKSDFTKAGISSPPTTWTEYVTDAEKVMAANPGVYGAGFDPGDSHDPWQFIWDYTRQLGGTFVTSNAKSATLNSPKVQQAMAFYFAQDYKFHIVPPQSLTWNNAQMFTAFSEGKIAMMPAAAYSTELELAGTPVAGKVGFALLPNVPYGMSARPAGSEPAETIVGGNDWIIAEYAGSKTQLALDFAKLSVSPEAQLEQFRLTGALPATVTGAEKVENAAGQNVKPFITASGEAALLPPTAAWSYVENGMETVVNRVATQLATTHGYSTSYASSQLAAEQSEVTAHLTSG